VVYNSSMNSRKKKWLASFREERYKSCIYLNFLRREQFWKGEGRWKILPYEFTNDLELILLIGVIMLHETTLESMEATCHMKWPIESMPIVMPHGAKCNKK